MFPSGLSTSMVIMKLVFIVLLPMVQSQISGQQSMSCNASFCTSTSMSNGCVGSINCYTFNTSSGARICSPARACSLFDVCSSNGSTCPSSNYVCIVDSCCSSPICVPSSLINMCNIISTVVVPTPSCVPTAGVVAFPSYNLITLNDLSTSSDVENRTLICGSLSSSSSANFATQIVSNSNSATRYSLELNGQIVSGSPIQVNAGSFGVGSNPMHTIVASGSVSYTLDSRIVNINGGNQGATISVNANLSAKCTALTNDLRALSSSLAALTNTQGNNVTIPTLQTSPLNFYVNNVDPNGIAVFNLVGNTVLNNVLVQQIELIVGTNIASALKLVVINLSGTSISFAQGNLAGTWFNSISTGRARTLWNLPQATSLNIARNWMGALLAPFATVTASNNIDGAVAVLSLTTTAALRDPPIALPACIMNNIVNAPVVSSKPSVFATEHNGFIMLTLFCYFLHHIFDYHTVLY